MAKRGTRSTPGWTPRLLLLAGLGFLAVGAAASAPDTSPETPPTGHPPGELICHTDVAAECYPRVFQATDAFQPVRADQDLPPGLHVRLNVYTGEREAKLVDPAEDDDGLAGMPVVVDQGGIVAVDPPAVEAAPAMEAVPKLPKGAPAYDPVGAVKKSPGGGGGGGEAAAFQDAVAVVRGVAAGQAGRLAAAEAARLADALEQLSEFAHDIYYGLKLAEDHAATQQLLCLMSGGGGPHGDRSRAQKAAAIVGAAVQNNPTALRAVERQWDAYRAAPCGGTAAAAATTKTTTTTTLGDVVFGPYTTSDDTSDDTSDNGHAAWVRSRLLAINGLIKSEPIMQDFLARDGLAAVLQLLGDDDGGHGGRSGRSDIDNDAVEAARARAAHLVSDNFLDASMGADVSRWPAPADGWREQIRRRAAAHGADEAHWSHELWRRLK